MPHPLQAIVCQELGHVPHLALQGPVLGLQLCALLHGHSQVLPQAGCLCARCALPVLVQLCSSDWVQGWGGRGGVLGQGGHWHGANARRGGGGWG